MKWLSCRLGDLVSLEYGHALPRALRDPEGQVVVAGSNGPDGYHSKALVGGPGIVVGRKGSAGKVVWYDTDFWPIDTTYFVRLRIPCCLRWVYYLLLHLRLETLTSTTGVPGLNREVAYRVPVLLPPLSEQRRIVEILDQADALRKKRAEADAKAARILPALFYKMFGDPATNPKGLEQARLGDVIKVRSGAFLPSRNMDSGGQYPVYGGNGINGYHSQPLLDGPAIIIGRVGVYCGSVHYCESACWVTDNALYVAEHDKRLHPRYLAEALRLANLNEYAGRAGQPLISGSRIYPVKIMIPEWELQVRFAHLVEETKWLGQKLAALDQAHVQLFARILHRAFTGDLTARWREAHMKELLAEMEAQAKALEAVR